MNESVSNNDLALVLLGCWVDVGDHGCCVGHEDCVHQTPRHHADHNDPHFNIIWRERHQHMTLFSVKCQVFIAEGRIWYTCAFFSDGKRKSIILTRWCIHGAIREGNHLRESSENSPRVLHDHCGVLEMFYIINETFCRSGASQQQQQQQQEIFTIIQTTSCGIDVHNSSNSFLYALQQLYTVNKYTTDACKIILSVKFCEINFTIRFSFRTQQSVGNSSSIGTKYWMQPFQWHSRKIIMNRDKMRKNRRTTSKFAFDTCQEDMTRKHVY